MSVKTYGRIALIGGSSGALDEYDADNLNEGDRCLTILSTGEYYFHRLNATSGAAESSPDVIKPDSGGGVSPYTGDKRWILIELGNIASIIHGVSAKTTPVDADEIGLIDSAASWVLKKLTWSNLKATLKTYFDGIYAALAHKTRHENAGADEISVAGLSGLLADDQHVLDAEVLAAAGANSGITSMTGLDNDGIPKAKVVGTVKADEADTTLSGTPKVFTIYSGATPYYFKAYPTKT